MLFCFIPYDFRKTLFVLSDSLSDRSNKFFFELNSVAPVSNCAFSDTFPMFNLDFSQLFLLISFLSLFDEFEIYSVDFVAMFHDEGCSLGEWDELCA